MQDTSNVIVDNKIFNEMVRTSIALVESIRKKQGKEGTVITEEEANFTNAFIVFAKEIEQSLQSQKEEE